MKVFSDLRTRGCQDILIAVTDDLKGMPEALAAVFPKTTLQTCIVHLIRRSLDFASWKERRALSPSRRRVWPQVILFFAFPPAVRRILYTTNALESVHARLRKIIKTRGHFPHDDAAAKLLWLALRNITQRWTLPVREWRAAMHQFAILYEDRFLRRDG